MLAWEACQGAVSMFLVTFGTYLKNSQFMHILILACRYHILQNPKLLVHFRSASSLDHGMGSLPGHPLPCRACSARLLLTPRGWCRRGGRHPLFAGTFGGRAYRGGGFLLFRLLLSRLHLYNLPGACRRRRQGEGGGGAR